MLKGNSPSDVIASLTLMAFLAAAGIVSRRYSRGLRARAEKKDHVAEVERDLAIPERCVGCDSPHAPFTYPVTSTLIGQGYSRYGNPFDFLLPHDFLFHFCAGCSGAMSRRRRHGTFLILAGIALIASPFLFSVLSANVSAFRESFDRWSSSFGCVVMMLLPIAGLITGGIGWWMRGSSPVVSILDEGGDTILFRFRSQLFRNEFATLNGAK